MLDDAIAIVKMHAGVRAFPAESLTIAFEPLTFPFEALSIASEALPVLLKPLAWPPTVTAGDMLPSAFRTNQKPEGDTIGRSFGLFLVKYLMSYWAAKSRSVRSSATVMVLGAKVNRFDATPMM